MKPGYQTTEFWVTAVTQVIAILTTVAVLSPRDAGALTDNTTSIVTAIFTLGTNAAAVIHYIRGRHALKAKGNP